MDYLSRINIFVEAAKNESFTKAAHVLGYTSAAVSKQIQNLENDLQTKLFNRTTRKVSLTEEGRILYSRAKYAIEGLQEAREELDNRKATPKGHLRVTLPLSLGLHYLKEPIAVFAKKYPEISLDIRFDDRKVNLAEEEYDIAFRIGALKNSSLIARKLASIPIQLFSSPEYLKEHGDITRPEQLSGHDVFEYTKNEIPHVWRYRAADKTEGQVDLKSRLQFDSVEMMKVAAMEGVGVFLSPRIFVQQELRSGQLVNILGEYITVPERGLYALFPPNRYASNRIKLFIDHIQNFCDNTFKDFI